MRELLQAFGLVKPKPPRFVRAFDEANERVNVGIEKKRCDAFSDMMDGMAGRPGRKKSGERVAKSSKRGG